jgi:hypothetical protein
MRRCRSSQPGLPRACRGDNIPRMRAWAAALLLAACNANSLEPTEKADGGVDLAANDGSATLNDSAVPLPCSAACTTGCCDPTGVCHSGLELTACGAGGHFCSPCTSSQCVQLADGRGGQCVSPDGGTCGPGNCSGCCQGASCITAISDSACGTGGEACSVCQPGDFCKGGCFHSQPNCGPSNCNGCCEGPYCATGLNNNSCGVGGESCQNCVVGPPCQASGLGGACGGKQTCNQLNCRGCCMGIVCVDGMTDSACGSNGDDCKACASGESCQIVYPWGGACEAPPFCSANCFGCCQDSQCMTGDSDTVCGGNTSACQDCTRFGAHCGMGLNGHKCVINSGCTAQSCAGCCYGDVCAVGTQAVACGVMGAACVDCSHTGQVCVAGSCH